MPSDTKKYNAFLAAWTKDAEPPSPELLSAWTKLLKDHSVPASDIAKEAVIPIAKRHEASNPLGPECIDIWRLLVDTVEKMTEQNDRLVEFVVELQKLPDCDQGFHDLPQLAQYLSESSFDYIDDGRNRAKRQAWANINRFTAKLGALGLPPTPKQGPNVELGGIVLRTTLEKPWTSTAIKALNGWVPAAEQWIKYCGNIIYKSQGDMESEWPSMWKGKKGWSRERWSFWKQRFFWITTLRPLTERTREIAKECADEMTRIEESRS
ncbi:hypothetical protein ASPWEDRAFT_169785 [Aspergillus wentii DTO 134E9]|uniref:Uncharacterized protein n=1 Tax=Aspergillus wentii DTO 134E9 TaxID=1073089 RepID=A0A1L9RYD9_ASPWE|nr:uncharacterized protein ASPWEDRAFT_169785 [Aspergillus wentii DTO 134E9]KAI9931372.1 hypothetical protein MW887_009947 [Aspergillus wentii]OJJ39961.1 hypothetical protein ASPWEDRAFT_169785 [Aspergillus wentii DTO 134E9]